MHLKLPQSASTEEQTLCPLLAISQEEEKKNKKSQAVPYLMYSHWGHQDPEYDSADCACLHVDAVCASSDTEIQHIPA